MTRLDAADDFVIGVGEARSVCMFPDEAFGHAKLDWRECFRVDPCYFRPNEVDYLLVDAGKTPPIFSWEPRITFRHLVRIRIDADLELAGLPSPGEGTRILRSNHPRRHRREDQVVSMERL